MTGEVLQNKEKVTLTLPASLKKRLLSIKEQTGMSMSAIYTEALREYIAQKERQKWRDAAMKARKHYLEDEELTAWHSLDGEDFHEY